MTFHEVYENRIRFEETDMQGIVFYGNYVTFQDETFSAYLREIGFPWTAMEAADWDVHVVHVDMDYRDSARFPDELVHGIRCTAIRESSMEFDYRCRNRDGDVLAEGGLTHVAVADGATTRVPDEFRDAVVDYQDEAPDPV